MTSTRTFLNRLFIALSISGLAACSTGSMAVKDTIGLAFGGDKSGALSAPVNPAYRYLKVTSYGRPAYLVLGYEEQPDSPQGPLQVWYSAKGEVIKLQAGRLLGTAGLELDWREVHLRNAPTWSNVAAQPNGQALSYQRQRDIMPGYRGSILDNIQLQAVSAADAQSALGDLVSHLSKQTDLRWYRETSQADNIQLPMTGSRRTGFTYVAALQALPAWYALNARNEVVLTYQCVTRAICLTMEPWAPAATP